MARITVYTTTYNRAYTLNKGYEALLRQGFKDFEWLIVDDGSTDDTRKLVEGWIEEKKISIRYIYQENKGVNVARNVAVENIDSELSILVDSDDYLTDDALESVIDLWDRNKGKGYVGIIAMDKYPNGQIIGTPIPSDLYDTTLTELYDVLHIEGDKKMVYSTDLNKKFPTPVIEGERYYPNREKYYRIDSCGKSLVLHKAICVAEYLPDGITASRYSRYIKNPKGFMRYRKFLMEYNQNFRNCIKQSIHYNAKALIAKGRGPKLYGKFIIYRIITFPCGVLLYIYIKLRAKREKNEKNKKK